MALRQAQEAVKAAIAAGHLLIEVDLPTGGRLSGVSGDSEGQREMNELSAGTCFCVSSVTKQYCMLRNCGLGIIMNGLRPVAYLRMDQNHVELHVSVFSADVLRP